MKICAVSDLHGNLPKLPSCDLLLIGGDISPLNIQSNMPEMRNWLISDFKYWLQSLEFKEVILVAGNHDFYFERNQNKVQGIITELSRAVNITYLKNQLYETYINGERITIFGTPYCHQFGNWAFMREDDKLREYFAECPDEVDIILSHDAPYGITDVCLESTFRDEGEHIGNIPLRERLETVNFKYLIHGHLHSSEHNLTKFKKGYVANSSLLNEKYKLVYPPLLIDY